MSRSTEAIASNERRWKGLPVNAIERLLHRKTLLAPIPDEWREGKPRVNLASGSITPEIQEELFSQLKLGVVFGTWPQESDIPQGEGFEIDQSRNMGRAYAIRLRNPITIDGVIYTELHVKGGGMGLSGLLGRYENEKHVIELTERLLLEKPETALAMVTGFMREDMQQSRAPIGFSGETTGYVESVVANELHRVGARVELPQEMLVLDREAMLIWASRHRDILYPLEYILSNMHENPALLVRLVTSSARLQDLISNKQAELNSTYRGEKPDIQGRYSQETLLREGISLLSQEILADKKAFANRYRLSEEEVERYITGLQSGPEIALDTYLQLLTYFQGWNQGITQVVSHVRFGNRLFPPHHRPGDTSITGARTDFEAYLPPSYNKFGSVRYEILDLNGYSDKNTHLGDSIRYLLRAFGKEEEFSRFRAFAEEAGNRGIAHAVEFYKAEGRKQDKNGRFIEESDLFEFLEERKRKSKEKDYSRVDELVPLNDGNQKVYELLLQLGISNEEFLGLVRRELLWRQLQNDTRHLHPVVFPSWLQQLREGRIVSSKRYDIWVAPEALYFKPHDTVGQSAITLIKDINHPDDISFWPVNISVGLQEIPPEVYTLEGNII